MRIVKGQTNTVALTLSQDANNNDSEWIIEFIDVPSKQSKVVGLYDISEYQERANIFEITESDDEDVLNSIVSLSEGQYDYKVYEMSPSSPRDLDTNNAIELIQEGVCIVADESTQEDNSFNEDDSDSHGIFNP